MAGETTVPDDLLDLVTTDRIGHVSWSRADGTVVTHLMWIDWDGDHILTSSPVGSVKGQHARVNGHVSVSVVDRDDLGATSSSAGTSARSCLMRICPSSTRCRSATRAIHTDGAGTNARFS